MLQVRAALALDSPRLFGISGEACRAAAAQPPQSIVAAVFAGAAIEGFSNELAELAVMHSEGLSPDVVTDFARRLTAAEEARASAIRKIEITGEVFGFPFDKGKQPYQDVRLLFKMRNALLHLKPEHFRWDPDDQTFEPEHHAVVTELSARGIIDPPPRCDRTSWLDNAMTQETAVWAYNAAAQMAHSLIDIVPQGAFALKIMFIREAIPLIRIK